MLTFMRFQNMMTLGEFTYYLRNKRAMIPGKVRTTGSNENKTQSGLYETGQQTAAGGILHADWLVK